MEPIFVDDADILQSNRPIALSITIYIIDFKKVILGLCRFEKMYYNDYVCIIKKNGVLLC